MSSKLPRIIVVGGGAGGLELVTTLGKTLGKKKLAKVYLSDGFPVRSPQVKLTLTISFNYYKN